MRVGFALLLLALAGPVAAATERPVAPEVAFGEPAPGPFAASAAPAAPLSFAQAEDEPVAFLFKRKPKAAQAPKAPPVLGAERARILLRSLTLPGWGQASLGRTTSARVFALADVGVWASFAAFRIQQQLRTDSYERTARLLAGIDLDGRDEEYRRIVGSFLSSEEYNLYIVSRDAANLYPDDPAGMRAYIDTHSLRGQDAWNWNDVESILRYRGQRKEAQRASLRANTALALAIANRLVSAVHAARAASHPPAQGARSWNLEVVPVDGHDATAFHLGVRTRF